MPDFTNRDDDDHRHQNGGVIKHGKYTPSFKSNYIPPAAKPTSTGTEAPVRIYKDLQYKNKGILANKPENYTLYDLILDPDPEIGNHFESWVFPDVATVQLDDGTTAQYVIPVKNFHTGSYGRSSSKVTQYVYALLNPVLGLVQRFGQLPGMTMSRTNYLVCCYVGDPTYGKLDQAMIRYVVPVNAYCRDVVKMASIIQESREETRYYYELHGDTELSEYIAQAWFSKEDYLFNGVIYPKVRDFAAHATVIEHDMP